MVQNKDRQHKKINELENLIKQYQSVLSNSSLLLYFNHMGALTFANQEFLKVGGWELKDIMGKKLSALLENEKDIYKIWDDINENGYFYQSLIFKSKTNKTIQTKSYIHPLKDTNNKTISYLCTIMDISKYEEKKIALKESLKSITELSIEKDSQLSQYRELLNRSVAFVKVKDRKIIDINVGSEAIIGYQRSELINKNIGVLFKNPDEFERIRNHLLLHSYWKGVAAAKHRSGKTLYLQAYLMSIVSDEYEGTIAVLHDITELFNMQEELISVQREVIFAMGAISEGRSRETGNHVKRVAEYSYLLALLYGLNEEEAELLKIASPMHDIGKLAIPDAILHKPGPLTNEEMVIMRTHARRGYEMLSFSNRKILKTAAEIALNHHEWWNGMGYPNKLRGYDIPIFGRITALADVFDALSNDRCYKEAWSMDEVVSYIISNKGKQFEASLVDLLVNNLDKFLIIKERFKDV